MIYFVTIVLTQLVVYLIAAWFGRMAFRREMDRAEKKQSESAAKESQVAPNQYSIEISVVAKVYGVDPKEYSTPPTEAKADEPYRRKLSKSEIEFNKRLMDDYIEKFPNSPFHDAHPEFMEDYLKRIDLSELGLDGEK